MIIVEYPIFSTASFVLDRGLFCAMSINELDVSTIGLAAPCEFARLTQLSRELHQVITLGNRIGTF